MGTTFLKLEQKQTISDLLAQKGEVIDLLPQQMHEVTQLDAEYHANSRETWLEDIQINTRRNMSIHEEVMNEVCKNINDQSVLLELGGGVGFDADLFIRQGKPFKCYILSEISCSMLEHAKNVVFSEASHKKPIVFCALDANQIMIEADQVDTVLMIAALHHVPNLSQTMQEMDRVTKQNARIVIGIEPNLRMNKLMIGLRPLIRGLVAKKDHSAADEVAEGFTIKDFEEIAVERNWEIEKLVPMWFLTGFLHYVLKFSTQLLRLDKNVRVPKFVERLFLGFDKLFFLFPYTKNLAWHYTVVYKKKNQ